MATLTIHNIPDDLLKKLERSALENHRTVDEEAVNWLSSIEVRDLSEKPPAKEIIKELRELRKQTSHIYVKEEDLNRAKRDGRL